MTVLYWLVQNMKLGYPENFRKDPDSPARSFRQRLRELV